MNKANWALCRRLFECQLRLQCTEEFIGIGEWAETRASGKSGEVARRQAPQCPHFRILLSARGAKPHLFQMQEK